MCAKKKRNLAIVAALSAAVVLVAAFCMGMMGGGPRGGPGDEAEEETLTTVDVTSPTMGSLSVVGEYIGTVEPGQQVTVFPKASGEVLSVNYNVGDTVEAGSVLFQIDSTSLEYSIAQTQASLSTAQAKANFNLEQAQKDKENYEIRMEEGINNTLISAESTLEAERNKLASAQEAVDTAKLAVQSASSDLSAARRNYRYGHDDHYDTETTDAELDTLRDRVVAAENTLEARQTALEQAEAALERQQESMKYAEQNYNSSLRAVEESTQSVQDAITSAQINANLTAEQIALQKLQNDLGDYSVLAPISGVIEQRNVDPYDMVSTGTASFVLSNKEQYTVSFDVTEVSLATMRVGDTVTVEKDGKTCAGAISEITTMVNSNGLYTVKATVQYPPFDLYSGSVVKVYADTQKAENSLIIPIDCIYYESGRPYVYVVEDHRLRQVFVETGIANTAQMQILSGLSTNDQVVTTWSANLIEGLEVVLLGEEPARSSRGEDGGEAGQGGEGRPDTDDAGGQNGPGGSDGDAPDNGEDGEAPGRPEEDAA